MEKLDQELGFLLGPGFSSTLSQNYRNNDSNMIEIATIVQSSGVNSPRALDLHLM